jgi:hypothetical protein
MGYARDISRAIKVTNDKDLSMREQSTVAAVTVDSGGLAVMQPGSPVRRGTDTISAIKDPSDDLFLLPNHSIASRLVDRYFNEWGSFWPYINEVSFRETFRHIYQGTSTVPRIWLGLLNMAFAIAIQRTFEPNPNVNNYSESYRYYARATQICDSHTLMCANLETGKCHQSTTHRE